MQPQKTDLRIISGNLRGRKVTCIVHEALRPTPQMVREALFSILGNAIPNRPFIDIFAGTGVVGIEAISRGAANTTFLERDPKLAANIETHLKKFGIEKQGNIYRSDVYRWAERWIPPKDQPVNLFLSPPFIDLTDRVNEFMELVRLLMEKAPEESVIVVQAENGFQAELLPEFETWDYRKYGRNLLLIWVKGTPKTESESESTEQEA
jgi:16S rRNA (guanine966-N2)-methyltransferase